MYLVHFPRSLTAIARAALAFVMLALTLLGSARSAIAATTITVSSIQPVASGFQFTASTGDNARWELQMSTGSIQFNGSTPYFSSGLTKKYDPYINSNYSWFANDLFPARAYNYIVKVTMLSGPDTNMVFYKSGYAGTTLHRKVNIAFDTITVTNDSDSSGAGELTYDFQVNGSYMSTWRFYRQTSSPVTFSISKSVFGLTDGGSYIPLKVEVQDDDCSFSTCVRAADFTQGTNSDNDWLTAKSGITFNRTSNSYSDRFSLTGYYSGIPLQFTVGGSYGVTFY
jgi:hypothetical protein